MPENDSRIRFAVTAATSSNSDRTRLLLLIGVGVVVLIAGAWLILGGGGDSGAGAANGLAEVQRQSYERRIAALKEELDKLAVENQELRSALIKAESEIVDYRQRSRREPGRVVE